MTRPIDSGASTWVEREGSRRRKRKTKKPRKPWTVSEATLSEAALSYLDRFDSSVKNLRRVLMRRVRKAAIESDVDTEQAAVWVDQLLARFVRSGVLDDERYARALSASLRRRGLSRRNILKKLSEKGIDSSVAEQMLVATDADEHGDEDDIDPEFAAALAYAKRRRLGAFKRRERDRDTDRKDIGALARAGFSYDIARRVLDFEPE